MSEINSCNSSNNNSNNEYIAKSVKIEVPCISQIISTVSQMISMCGIHIPQVDAIELSQCLPQFQNILSEISEMVAITQKHQQQNPEEWKEIWSRQDDSSMLSPCSSSSSIASILDSSESSTVDDLFVSKLSATIDKFAPDYIFNKKKAKRIRRKRRLSAVPKMFRSLWQYYDTILSPAVPSEPCLTPIVDWTKVNHRAFSNLPKPQDIPLHGCHKDPNLYCSWRESSFPFGSVPGFRTSLGIICCDAIREPIHGFIYNKEIGDWVIHASYRKDVNINNRRDVNFNNRKQDKRKLLEKKTGSTPIRRSPD